MFSLVSYLVVCLFNVCGKSLLLLSTLFECFVGIWKGGKRKGGKEEGGKREGGKREGGKEDGGKREGGGWEEGRRRENRKGEGEGERKGE